MKEFNNYLKTNVNTYETMYSKDFNRKSDKKKGSCLKIDNLKNMDSEEIAESMGIKKAHGEKMLQL